MYLLPHFVGHVFKKNLNNSFPNYGLRPFQFGVEKLTFYFMREFWKYVFEVPENFWGVFSEIRTKFEFRINQNN